MLRQRLLALVLVLYFSLDVMTPWWPGVFSFDEDGFFVDTVVEATTEPIRLLTEIALPRETVVSHVRDRAGLGTMALVAVHADVRARGRPRLLPSERSSLAPASLDDH